ncbi:MAG: ISAs1 family transposase [Lactobacillales bacterium]|nr:ISAs1 family transposase [Lactobacillales bacterium]
MSIGEIVLLVLIGQLVGAEGFTQIELYLKHHESVIRKFLPLENGIPSHDTMERVIALIKPNVMAELQRKWLHLQAAGETDKIKKLINIDGKTIRGNRNKHQNPLHIVSAYSDSDGLFLGQLPTEEKSNEITAIPKLIAQLDLKNTIITINAIGTQKKIAATILENKADYCLAVKENHQYLYEDIKDYLCDEQFQEQLKQNNRYFRTIEKARGQVEMREYFVTTDVQWLNERNPGWEGLKAIGMATNTIERDDQVTVENRYFILSLDVSVKEFAKCVRGHWKIESMHWLLDVVFREDATHILHKNAAQNLNILRKLALGVLKAMTFDRSRLSYKNKIFSFGLKPERYLRQLLEM